MLKIREREIEREIEREREREREYLNLNFNFNFNLFFILQRLQIRQNVSFHLAVNIDNKIIT